MCNKYLFIPYNFDPCTVDNENPQPIIVDKMQKTVIEKMIDCRIYVDGYFIDFDDIIDLTKETEIFAMYDNRGNEIMFEQILTLRMNLLGGMNEFVKTSIPSKFYIDLWQKDCISAEVTEEDLEMIANDNETFKDCITTFNYICSKIL